MRTLASIVEVGEVLPIEGADLIQLASIKDKAWKCVIKKGELQEGDAAIYFEIDSFLPEEDRYEFLRKSCYKTMEGVGGFRLKTIRLRGTLSQGLLMPITAFPGLQDVDESGDITEQLGVKLYEKPISACLSGKVKGNFPNFLRKSDQTRIQNLTKYFTEHCETVFEVTTKMDGSSCTVFNWDGEFGVCSRNLHLKETDNTFWQVVNRLNLRERLPDGLMLQGELVGEGIQKNPHKLKGHDLFVYDVFDIYAQKYIGPEHRREIIDVLNDSGDDIKHVPVVDDRLEIFRFYPDFESLMAFSESLGGEGIVCKSIDGQVSFKVINNNYLLA